MKDNNIKGSYTIVEEIANSITHGLGIVFSIVIITILLFFSILKGNADAILGFSIYGGSCLILYTASTLYHSIPYPKVKKVLRVFDHSSIFIFIAGTYTPIALITMEGFWKWCIFFSVWGIAVFGIIFKLCTLNDLDKYKKQSLALYIAMGWIAVIAFKPIMNSIPQGFMKWLVAGGVTYTLGTIFYSIKKLPFSHAIWHVFVLGGSVLHFIGIIIYLR